jgi:hypothetical protein
VKLCYTEFPLVVNSCLSMFTVYTWQIQVCRHSVFQCGSPVGGSIIVDQPELSHKRAYTRIGLYRGNIVAIKPVYKRSIDITRNIRKELKQVCCMYYIVYTSILERSHTLFAKICHTSTQLSPCQAVHNVAGF